MHEWTTKMQADFQMLALQAQPLVINPGERVNGLLVNVIEKPREYVPRRKCQACGEYWNYSAWQPAGAALEVLGGGGKMACPGCGNCQKLKPVESEKFQEASYFRMVVERTPEQLATSKDQITAVAEQMKEMEEERPK